MVVHLTLEVTAKFNLRFLNQGNVAVSSNGFHAWGNKQSWVLSCYFHGALQCQFLSQLHGYCLRNLYPELLQCSLPSGNPFMGCQIKHRVSSEIWMSINTWNIWDILMPKILFAAYLEFQYHLVSCTFIVAAEYGISTSTCPKYQMLKGRIWKCGWCSCPAVNIVNN